MNNYSAVFVETGTEADYLAPLRRFFDRIAHAVTEHSPRYNRMILSGEKPMPFAVYIGCLRKMFRRAGREAVASAVNVWLRDFGLAAMPCETAPRKPVRDEVFEAMEATAHAFAHVTDAIRDGRITPDEKEQIHMLIARAQCELADVERAVA